MVNLISILTLFILVSCNPLSEGQDGSVKGANYQPGLSSQPFNGSWTYDSDSTNDYTYPSSLIEFNNGEAKLVGNDQVDDDDSSSGFGGGNLAGLLWDNTRSVLRIDPGFARQELDSSWTPQWSNIIGYWKFNNDWLDAKGSYHFNSSNASFINPSVLGSHAADFNGSGSYLISSTSLPNLTSVTLSFWARRIGKGTGYSRLIAWNGYKLEVADFNSTGKIGIYVPGLGWKDTGVYFGTNWNHFAVTASGSSFKVYLNNKLIATYTVSINLSGALFIGKAYTGTEYFKGFIDELGIWSTALSAAEISQIYNNQAQNFTGTFTSRIMDAMADGQEWKKISWKTTLPFLKELPDASCTPVPPATTCLHSNNERSNDYSSLVGSTAQTQDDDLMNGIVGLWHLNEGSWNGTIGEVKDDSGFNNNGTSVGAANTVSGKFFNGGIFSGANQRVDIPNASQLNISGDITVSAWFKTSGTNDYSGIVNKMLSGGTRAGYSINIDPNGNARCDFILSVLTPPYGKVMAVGVPAEDGNWHHVACRHDGSTIKIYFDGVEKGSEPYSDGIATNSEPLRIGWDPFSTARYFNGQIDEVSIWNRALDPEEIKQLYRRGGNRIKYQVRTCIADNCSDDLAGNNWKGPDGTNLTYFSELNNNSVQISGSGDVQTKLPSLVFSNFLNPIGTSRYFQYKAILETDDPNYSCDYGTGATACSPELQSVTVDPIHYDSLGPTIVGKKGLSFKSLSSLVSTFGAEGCSGGISYNLGVGANSVTASWYWWNGTKWINSSGTNSESNGENELNQHLVSFGSQVGMGTVFLKAYLGSTGTTKCSVDQIRLEGKR